jgi:hypothetical protein
VFYHKFTLKSDYCTLTFPTPIQQDCSSDTKPGSLVTRYLDGNAGTSGKFFYLILGINVLLPHPFIHPCIPYIFPIALCFSSAYVDLNNHVEYTENEMQCGKTLHKQDVTIHLYFSFGTIRASVSFGQESI